VTVIVVTGTPGVGKTTVLKKALERAPMGYSVVNYGDVMLGEARKRGVNDRDALRQLPSEAQREIQLRAAEEIANNARSRGIIVDTHCTVKTPSGYLPGLPFWVLEALKPEKFVLLEAEPEEIMGRRVKDKSRVRDAEVLSEIGEHQLVNKAMAMAYAAFTGATVKIIKNNDNKLDEAAENLLEVLEG
jgi:adenylate kinase